MFEQLGVIGCGLMGGSFALAMKRAGLVKRVVGYSKSPSTTQRALQMGVIDVEAPSALLAVSGADVVMISVPVSATEATFKAIRHLISANTLYMDVGSTKHDVVQAAERVLKKDAAAFVPCHPIAGREFSGVEYATPDLYTGSQVIITPTEQTSRNHLKRAEDLWRALGCRVTRMTPQDHDAAYAAVSHLPHMLAFAYMGTLLNQPNFKELTSLAGPGFRDFSRIAAADPKMWRDVLLANKKDVIAQSRMFQRALHGLEVLLNADNSAALEDALAKASQARKNWQDSASGKS